MENKLPAPLILEGNISENWKKFKQRFELYRTASGIEEKTDKVQARTLLHIIGEEGLEVFNSFEFESEADKDKLQKLYEKFDSNCSPKQNITWERHKCLQEINMWMRQ